MKSNFLKKYKNIIAGSTAAIVVGGVIIGSVWLLNNTLMGAKMKNSFKSSTTGLERSVNVYTYSGEKIAEYNGRISVDDGAGGTVSITLADGKKVVFANTSVVIEEK